VVILLPWYINRKKAVIKTNESGERELNTTPNTSPVKDKSIIVLPFENINPDPDQEYFSDGLTEEVITDLSYIDDLLVISRSSAMTFKGTRNTIKEIAEKVNVRYVLEGSVRKAGNNLRITAQLIDAITDSHLWAEKYTGTLKDVFQIQEKVSKLIAESIGIRIVDDNVTHKSSKAINNPAAYELYLKARYENWQLNEQSLRRAEELLIRGIKVIGDNELFYSELCHSNVQYVNLLLKDPSQYPKLLEKANEYADKAVQVNPESASVYYAQGIAFHQSGKPFDAIKSFRKALSLEPNYSDPMLYAMLGYHYCATGFNTTEGELLFEKAMMMDPMSPVIKGCHGWSMVFDGKFQESVDEMKEWQQSLEQVNSPFIIVIAWAHALNQELSEACRLIDLFVKVYPDHILSSLGLFMKYFWLNEKQKALGEVNDNLSKAALWDDAYSFIMAECYSILNEKEFALRWVNHSIDYGYTNIPFLTEYDPFLANIKTDRAFKQSIDPFNQMYSSKL